MIGNTSISVPEGKMKYLREQGYVGKQIILGIRPEDIHDDPISIDASTGMKITVQVDVSELTGAEILVHSNVNGQNFVARSDSSSGIKSRNQLELAFDMNKAHFFNTETEERINLVSDK